MFRKSAVDNARLIKRALDVDVSLYSSSELFILHSYLLPETTQTFRKKNHRNDAIKL